MTSSPSITAACPTRISSHLSSWSVYDSSVRTNLTSSALRTSEGWWIVDPSPISDQALDDLMHGDPVLGILLSNENHERASKELRQKKGWPIHTHQATTGRLELAPDRLFQGGENLKGEVQTAFIPGPSRGETAFYHKPSRTLIVGDALINLEESGFDLLPARYCHDPAQARRNAHQLLQFDFSILAFAHGPPLVENAKEQLKGLLCRS